MKKLSKTILASAFFILYSTEVFAQSSTSGEQIQNKIIGGAAVIITAVISIILLSRVFSMSTKMMSMGSDQRSSEEGQKLKTELIWLASGSVVGFSATGVTIWLTGLFS